MAPKTHKPPTRLDYCQFLLSSQINYTLTYCADHSRHFSHDQLNRLLRDDVVTPSDVWKQIGPTVVRSPNGYLVFDDTVADKNYSHKIELVRRQWSGNAKAVIKGIGVVTCVYVNPETDQFWLIDFRIYAPDEDGKTKLDHVREMFDHTLACKRLPVRTVLMDSWYADRKLMLHIERAGKFFCCPLKDNRQADESDGDRPSYRRVDALTWTEAELQQGKTVHLKDFPKGHRVKLFRLVLSSERTDYVATNDFTRDSTQAVHDECDLRWKIEQVHREAKQTTGLERCQCRKARIQRNHIACALLVWGRLKDLAYQTAKTLYQIKYGQLDDYMSQQLENPSVKMVLA